MKTTKLSLALIGLMIASSVIVSSCKKKDNTTTTTDNDTSAASDHATAENTASDVENMAAEASEQSSFSSYRLGSGQENVTAISCATLTYDTIAPNRKITASFNSTTTCLDGRVRSGTLTFDFSASPAGVNHYRNPGFNCTVTSQNYVVDGNAITINKNIVNNTAAGFTPASTNITWAITATVTIVKASGGTISYNCNRTKTLLNTSDANVYHGQTTHITWNLAKVGLTGNATGTTAAGNSFTANITSQLVRNFGGCNISGRHPFIQGGIDFTPGTKATRHIDYGNGTCDLSATVTINGISYPITLP